MYSSIARLPIRNLDNLLLMRMQKKRELQKNNPNKQFELNLLKEEKKRMPCKYNMVLHLQKNFK